MVAAWQRQRPGIQFLAEEAAPGQVAAFPRFWSGYARRVDYRASGVTYFDPANPQRSGRVATTGRYDYGKDRAEAKQKAINDA
jgi:hypothetical protein